MTKITLDAKFELEIPDVAFKEEDSARTITEQWVENMEKQPTFVLGSVLKSLVDWNVKVVHGKGTNISGWDAARKKEDQW